MKELCEFWPLIAWVAIIVWSIIVGLSQEPPHNPPIQPRYAEAGF